MEDLQLQWAAEHLAPAVPPEAQQRRPRRAQQTQVDREDPAFAPLAGITLRKVGGGYWQAIIHPYGVCERFFGSTRAEAHSHAYKRLRVGRKFV